MFLNTKTVQQVAALPFVPLGDGVEVLLVTSRHGGRWLLPKGWPNGKEPFAEAAAREALEEAGVVGAVHSQSIGEYTYTKTMPKGYQVRSHVFVYPVLTCEPRRDWPERDERSCRWVALDEAVDLVGDRGLSRLMKNLSRSGGHVLRNVPALEPHAPRG